MNFNDYLAHGNAWLFIPSAILLGALHGLEPGHSKTMMAAFIVSIRGTVKQAILLGLSATISHTGIIWIFGLAGLFYTEKLNVERIEPYFKVGIGILVIIMALWMFFRLRKDRQPHQHGAHGGLMLDTGHGLIELSVFETNVPPQFRIYFSDAQGNAIAPAGPTEFSLTTVRPDGETQVFSFAKKNDYLESNENIPEPHEFGVVVELKHHNHTHTYETKFVEHDHHHHDGLPAAASTEFVDAHEKAHAHEIEKRFANRPITTGQIILFGLTGGLLPCPAAFAVLLVCLQLKKFALGFFTVLAFSLGLAITLVAVGSIAALSAKHVTRRFKGWEKFARKAPYASAALMVVVGCGILWQGIKTLP